MFIYFNVLNVNMLKGLLMVISKTIPVRLFWFEFGIAT